MQHQITISVSTDYYLHTLYISRRICNTAKCDYWLRRLCSSAIRLPLEGLSWSLIFGNFS